MKRNEEHELEVCQSLKGRGGESHGGEEGDVVIHTKSQRNAKKTCSHEGGLNGRGVTTTSLLALPHIHAMSIEKS